MLIGCWWSRGRRSRPTHPLFGPRHRAAARCSRPKAAITFDDGPSAEYTPPILDALPRAGVRATFFVLGRHVRAHPEIARRIVAEGHELASHGDDHTLLTFEGPEAIAYQLRAPEEAVSAATGAAAGSRCSAPRTASAARSWPGRAPARLPRGGMDGRRLGHRQARRRADRRPQRLRPASGRDPAAARRRRLRQRRRPLADGGGAAARSSTAGKEQGLAVRDHLRAGRRAAPAAGGCCCARCCWPAWSAAIV